MSSDSTTTATHRLELRSAVRHLSDRCLYTASKWVAELLVGLDPEPNLTHPSRHHHHHHTPPISVTSSRRRSGSTLLRRVLRSTSSETSRSSSLSTPPGGVSYVSTPVVKDVEVEDEDWFTVAKGYFDCREYRRAAYALRNLGDCKSVFLRCYALYLAGEKRKDEVMMELDGPLGKNDITNSELVALERELSGLRRNGGIDSFGLYLYGIVLKDKGCESLARTVLVESVNSYPWNWSAWMELQTLCTSRDILNSLKLKNHWMKDFFLANVYQELKLYAEALPMYERLLPMFKFSDYIHAQIATVQYNLREFDDAEVIFQELLKADPYRVDFMDTYSNLLYAKESLPALSFLAHQVFLTDKYRPESCCIIANYYSLKGQHEKSVIYFRRALRLNRKYLAAWTLMGHEYVEMKNTPAAIDAYRRAVEINPRDYRAWYGLGQAYEMMNMHFYGLYYYKNAVFLQPNDARLLIALAHCYESPPLSMFDEAIKFYTRAANSNDEEGIALHQLAKLNESLGHTEEAVFYYKKDLEKMDAAERQGPNMIEALMFLAKYCQEENKLEEAEMYCNRLLDYTGPEREAAKSLLRGLNRDQHGFPSMDIDHFSL